MNLRTATALGLGLFLLGLLIGSSVSAASRPAPVIPAATPIQLGEPDQGRTEAPQATDDALTPWLGEGGSGGASPSPAQVTAAPRSTPSTNAPVANVSSRRSVSGLASWFCSSTSPCTRGTPASSMAAAAGPALRVGVWRGRWVVVNGLRVRLVDWCLCGGGRVIDLYAAAFAKLAPLSRGVVPVTVRW